MHDVDVFKLAGHDQVSGQRIEKLQVARVFALGLEGGLNPLHLQVSLLAMLVTKAENLDLLASFDPGQLPGQVFHMNASTTVDVRWILIRQ